jgi:AraC-like DNA-binding protein
MRSKHDLDRLLVTMDVAVQHFAVCEVRSGRRLLGAPVDAIMVHYVLEGEMHMAVPGHPTIVCGPGSVALIPPGLQPSMTADDRPATEVVGIDHASVSRDGLLVMDAADGAPGDLRFAAGIVVASLSGSFGLLDKLKAPIAEDMGDSPIVRQAYALMLEEITRPGLGTRALTGALMKTCLLMVLRRFFGRPGADQALIGALANERLARAVALVVDEPSSPHTVASMAERAGMSRSTFARQFSEAFQLSPMEFVAKTRLYHAAELLRSTKLPIKVIADSIGYASRSHFSRAFRDAYGSDPTRFREDEAVAALDSPRALHGSRARFGLSEEPK